LPQAVRLECLDLLAWALATVVNHERQGPNHER